jgi:hypothetical protein
LKTPYPEGYRYSPYGEALFTNSLCVNCLDDLDEGGSTTAAASIELGEGFQFLARMPDMTEQIPALELILFPDLEPACLGHLEKLRNHATEDEAIVFLGESHELIHLGQFIGA